MHSFAMKFRTVANTKMCPQGLLYRISKKRKRKREKKKKKKKYIKKKKNLRDSA